MSVVSVQEAARRLGASPAWVRRMAASGEIPAYRLGREWAVDERGLGRVRPRRRGRPLGARASWLFLGALSGEALNLPPASRVEAKRARDRAAAAKANGMGSVDVSPRADLRRFSGTPVQVMALISDRRVVRSGISAAFALGSDLLDSAREFEGYVRERDLRALVKDLNLEAAPIGDRGRVLLRVPRPVWPFVAGAVIAPRGVVAADLSEASDPRSQEAADGLLGLA